MLDNQPVHILLGRPDDPRHRRVVGRLSEASHALVPAIVRVESGAARTARNAPLNRLTDDAETHPLLRGRGSRLADVAIAARSGTARKTSPVDAMVAAVAAALPGRVEVLTSDPDDLRALRDAIGADFHVVSI